MKKTVMAKLAILMIIAISLSACSNSTVDAETGDNQEKNVYMIEEIDLPRGFMSDGNLFLCGNWLYVSLLLNNDRYIGAMNIQTNEWRTAELMFTCDDIPNVYGIYVVDEDVWMLTGDKHKILAPESSGRYSVLHVREVDSHVEVQQIPLNSHAEYLDGLFVSEESLIVWDLSELYKFDLNGVLETTINFGTVVGVSISDERLMVQSLQNTVHQDAAPGFFLPDIKNDDPGIFQQTDFYAESDCCVNGQDGFLIKTVDGLSIYSDQLSSESMIFSWLEIGCTSDMILNIMRNDNGDIFWYNAALQVLQKVIYGPTSDRTVIYLATGLTSSGGLTSLINQFNQNHTDYQIEMMTYNVAANPEELKRLNADILSENGPDIIDTWSIPVNVNNGNAFVDLLPYIENDPAFSLDDFLPNFMDGLMYQGHLYEIYSSFSIATMVARTSDVGKESGWTMEAFEDLIEKKSGQFSPFGSWVTREGLLETVCAIASTEYINWDEGTCEFACDDFAHWLSFCKGMRETTAGYEDALFSIENITSTLRPVALAKNMGEEITYIGFPASSGNGSYFTPDGYGFAILSTSNHKDMAWEFVRQILLPSWQEGKDQSLWFPSRIDSLDRIISNTVSDENSEFNQNDADQLMSMIHETTAMFKSDEGIRQIIVDETASFFSGERSLEDTIQLIQSRAMIYVAQNS